MSNSKLIRVEYTVDPKPMTYTVETTRKPVRIEYNNNNDDDKYKKKQHMYNKFKIIDSKNRVVDGTFKYFEGSEPTDGARWYMFVRGRITDPNGTIYEGYFNDNVLVDGFISFPDGNRYEGKFSNAKLISGTKIYANGVIVSGTFDTKSKFANGIKIYPDNRKYDVIRDPRSLGKDIIIYKGTLTYPDKTKIEGFFNSNFDLMKEDDVNDILV